jgi:DNA-directed RNA polymerase specialized sigma subunit
LEKINGITYEEAAASVQGSKYKALQKFKTFTTPDFGLEDIESELDMILFTAWKEWDPTQSKFNTYVTNRFNWGMYRTLETNNPTFKMNAMTKNDLKSGGETFEILSKKKVTKDEDFNLTHELDGKKEFTRDIWNQYIYKTSAKTFGVSMLGQSQFTSSEDSEFDIMDVAGAEEDEQAHFDMMVDHDFNKLDETRKLIVNMLRDGSDIKEVARTLGMSATKLLQTYAPNENSNKKAGLIGKAAAARANKRVTA